MKVTTPKGAAYKTTYGPKGEKKGWTQQNEGGMWHQVSPRQEPYKKEETQWYQSGKNRNTAPENQPQENPWYNTSASSSSGYNTNTGHGKTRPIGSPAAPQGEKGTKGSKKGKKK